MISTRVGVHLALEFGFRLNEECNPIGELLPQLSTEIGSRQRVYWAGVAPFVAQRRGDA